MIGLIYFLACLLIVVSLHELGHLVAALACGVKVEAYSIGFGKPLFKKKIKGIEFRLSPLPFGGYVQLKGEKSKVKNGFLAQPYHKKLIILLAGCLVNLLLSALIYFILYKSVVLGFVADWLILQAMLAKDYFRVLYLISSLTPHVWLIQLTLLSTFCGLFNLLPLPALDGGSIWLVWLEKIYKKKFPKIFEKISKQGFFWSMLLQFIFLYWFWFI